MYRLPQKNRDLQRLARQRDVMRVLGCLLWIALWVGGAISYNANHQTYPPHRRIIGWKMLLLCLIAAATGFLIFRCWKIFSTRTISGVILSSGISRSYSASSDAGRAGTDYDFRINTALTIQTDDKKKCRLCFEQKNGFYSYYHEGERIVRFHGLPYPINLDPNAPHGYVCAACGFHTDQYVSPCEHCHHTLIDPKDLVE